MPTFDEECLTRVERDNLQFGIESVYLPNVRFSNSPRLCLISQEPSMGKVSPQVFAHQVVNGFRNFLKTEGDLIVHFCAYMALGRRFDYHLTDVAKGAMPVQNANQYRKRLYENWLPILQEEIRDLESPVIVSVGTKVRDFLATNDFHTTAHVRHFAVNNDGYFTGYFDAHRKMGNLPEFGDVSELFADFCERLLLYLMPDSLNRGYIETIKNRGTFTDAGKGRFLYYRDKFAEVVV